MKIYYDTWLLYRILSFLSALCKSPTRIFSAAWMQMTEVCMFFCLFVCGREWACHTVESDGLLTQRISDLESISCIIHRRSVCDTHLCARQSVRTGGRAEVSVSLTWKGLVSSESPVLSSAQPVCQGNKFTPGYKWPARAGMGWHHARASFPVLFLFKHPVGWMVSAAPPPLPPRSFSPAARAGFTSKQGKLMKQHMSNGI